MGSKTGPSLRETAALALKLNLEPMQSHVHSFRSPPIVLSSAPKLGKLSTGSTHSLTP